MVEHDEPGGDLTLARLAAALGEAASAAGEPLAAPVRERRALLLRIARDVAHAGERQNAPLATYLAGRYVERRRGEGCSEDQALAEFEAVVGGLTAPPAE